ncbi:PQQ-dependent sugar dehydrogenase [Haloferula sp.]|uniref:PQQ-dependent sugar dehydrogenase n=1 Tax=Haloferula sp. TaxID=2497595 RepID=UPI00329EBE9F
MRKPTNLIHRNALVKLGLIALAPLSLLLCLETAHGQITIHGSSSAYTETGGDWLSMGSNDIDGSGGLGTDGWLFFMDSDASSGGIVFSDHVKSTPSYVTGFFQGANVTGGADDYGGYGQIDDPNTLDGSDIGAGFLNSTTGNAGTNNEIVTFTVAGLAANTEVRVGVLAGIESNSDGRWDPTSITLSDGSSSATVGVHGTSDLIENPGGGNTGWVFFDIDADGTYAVSCTKRVNNQGSGIAGLTFDSAITGPPPPSSTLLEGQSIGIDFGVTAPVAGSNFNHFSDVDISNGATETFAALGMGDLINTAGGTLTDVGFTVTNLSGQDSGRATVTGEEGFGSMADATIYGDSIISNSTGSNPLSAGGNLVLTFTGLDDALTYKLTGGYDQNNDNFDATWEADGKSFTTDGNLSGSIGYDSLTGLSTDGSGNLVITVTRSLHVTIAGLELEAISLTNPDGGLNFPLTTPEGGYSFPNAFEGVSFTDSGTWITAMESLPGHPEKLFVVVSNGRVWMIPDITAENPTKVLILDRSSVDSLGYFNGMGGVAFHPDFDNNGYLYVTYPSSVDKWTRVSRFTVADPANIGLINNATEQVLIEDYFHRAHGFNRLIFGPDGYLYIPVGDGKQVGTEQNRPSDRITQTIDEGFWSSVLRIDVDKKPGNYEPQNLSSDDANGKWTVPTTDGLAHYSIPADNPFLDSVAADGTGISTYYGKAADPTKVRTEMYAIGFRNPWKIGFVPNTNELWVADVMNSKKERYMIIPKGGNGGWAFFSGTGDVEYLQADVTFPTGFQWVQPVVEYYVTDSNSGSNNKSIIGGEFYQSTDIPALTGSFLMCDYNRGDIWAVHRPDHSAYQMVDAVDVGGGEYALDGVGMTDTTHGGVFAFSSYNSTIQLIGDETGITAMLPNPTTGEMLLADSDNKIIRKIAYTSGDIDSQLPQTLSETGAFTDPSSLAVNPEMHPYDINLAFWSDGALKSRWFNMVDTTGPIQYSQDDFWDFPTGTVTMKHFDMDLDRDNPGTNVKRIETRFIVKTDDDYYGITYQWNEEGTEATLVDEDGVNLDLDITEGGSTTTQAWRIPSRAECVQCHTDNNNAMLGLNTRQLNRNGELAGDTGNFLSLMETAGYLSTIGEDPATLPVHNDPGDTAINLEERVRSYIAVNCAYCHYEGNGLVPPSWSGEPHLTIEETNLLHGEAVGFNVIDPTDRLIIPGDTTNSIILSRAAASNGYGRMPPIGSAIPDPAGVALLTDWINNYANAKPTLDAAAGPYTVAENTSASTSVGSGPSVSDLDSSDPTRGTLLYSIVGGNTGGYFDINPTTGEITVVQDGLDYEETTSQTLSILVSDGFAPNPGEIMTNVVVDVSDVVGDDSQGDGIEDEWAMANFGFSAIDPTGDTDKDGSIELFEFWADSDPNDPSSRGLVIAPYAVTTDPGNEGYSFEWTIRADLTIGTDYEVQGANDLGFVDLEPVTDFTVISSDPVDNGEGPALTRMRVKVPTTSDRYFLRLASVSQ